LTGALVSGEARVAVFRDGDELWCIRPREEPQRLVSPGLLAHLFENVSAAIYYPEATLESTSHLLERACQQERGLQLTLISMDPASSETTRALAEDALEEFLEDQGVSDYIENRLFSNCLPDKAFWSEHPPSDLPQSSTRVNRMTL